MKLSWEEAKRQTTLAMRGLDFAWAEELFDGMHFTMEDLRRDRGEHRFVSAGHIKGRLCIVVWTPRTGGRRVISLRKANEREKKRFAQGLVRP